MKTHSLNDWIKAGDYYRGKGNFEKAIGAFVQARLALLADMGECFTRLGKLEEAQVLFEEILEADIRNVRANAGLGIVSLLAGAPEAAALAFGNVLHVDPREPKALCGLGMARLQLGQNDEGMALLQQSLDEVPDNLAALDELVRFASGPGGEQYRPAAQERCRKYLTHNPDAPEVRDYLKRLDPAPAAGRSQPDVLASLVAAFQADPYHRPTVLTLAQHLGGAGLGRDGWDVCAVYLQRYPGDADVLSLQRSL
jgi:tetratricopeptide (TPR) repeat protein